MWDKSYELTPTNFPEEEKLMKRCYRLLASVQSVAHGTRKTRPRFARDMEGLYWLIGRQINSLESQLHHPGRLRTWMDEDAQAKNPPPSEKLLVKLFSITRQAAAAVAAVHNHVAEQEEGKEACNCNLCADIWDLRWLLGKVRRLFVEERKAVQS
jgi:hypothetical protein